MMVSLKLSGWVTRNLNIERIQTKCSDFRFNLPIVKTHNTYFVGVSSVDVSFSN